MCDVPKLTLKKIKPFEDKSLYSQKKDARILAKKEEFNENKLLLAVANSAKKNKKPALAEVITIIFFFI